MKLNIRPPLNLDQSVEGVRKAQEIWNSDNINQFTSLLSENCEWRDSHQHLKGRAEIAEYMSKKRQLVRNYSVKAELWSYSTFRLAVSFYSEWQHSKKDVWFRSSGHIQVNLDQHGLINEFCLSTNGKAVQVKKEVSVLTDNS
jgi:nuclear transport factor 2 (NTF2) superfamily protein